MLYKATNFIIHRFRPCPDPHHLVWADLRVNLSMVISSDQIHNQVPGRLFEFCNLSHRIYGPATVTFVTCWKYCTARSSDALLQRKSLILAREIDT